MKILGCGVYTPGRKVFSEELDELYSLFQGDTERITGVKCRYYADPEKEKAGEMARWAAEEAVRDAGIKPEDIDLIIGANATMEQVLPCTAALIQRRMGLEKSGIPTFDVNSSCLSFCNALDVAELYLKSGKYKNILIVSSEIASVGLNYKHIESAGLFGDGAAAFIVGRDNNRLFHSLFETYSEGYHYTEIRGGGTRLPMQQYRKELEDEFKFSMDGSKVFRLTRNVMPDFFSNILKSSGIPKNDIDLFIPHQASLSAIKLMTRHLGLKDDRVIEIVSGYGNMIAASIPFALAGCIRENRLKKGNKVMLIGTSAGFSLGSIIFEY